MRSERGFTIVELLLAIALFSIASISIYFNFQTGLFLHSRIGKELERFNEYRLCFDKMDIELHNMILFDDAVFKGEKRSITFPAFIEVYENGERRSDFFMVTYEFKANVLYRVTRSLKKKALSNAEEQKVKMMSALQGGMFEYAYRTPAGGLVWKETWNAENVPFGEVIVPYGVRLRIENIVDVSKNTTRGRRTKRIEGDQRYITKTFVMPLGTLFEVKLNE